SYETWKAMQAKLVVWPANSAASARRCMTRTRRADAATRAIGLLRSHRFCRRRELSRDRMASETVKPTHPAPTFAEPADEGRRPLHVPDVFAPPRHPRGMDGQICPMQALRTG